MATVRRRIEAEPAAVFDVLADGWLYPLWVVGTSHPRAVDADWPAVGSKLHHASGLWPLVVRDHTQILGIRPGRHLRMTARGWPFGEAMVSIDVDDDPVGSLVTMHEQPVKFPGVLLRNPAADAALYRRNVESLDRLAALVERRTSPQDS